MATACSTSDEAGHTVEQALEFLISDDGLSLAQATLNQYCQKGGHLLRLLGSIGSRELGSLALDDVNNYITQRIAEGAARETVRKELVVLRQAIAVAKKREILAEDGWTCTPTSPATIGSAASVT